MADGSDDVHLGCAGDDLFGRSGSSGGVPRVRHYNHLLRHGGARNDFCRWHERHAQHHLYSHVPPKRDDAECSGQIVLPSFIAEMKDPRDFPKVLIAVTVSEMIVFSLAGGIMYWKLGQYTTGPPPFFPTDV